MYWKSFQAANPIELIKEELNVEVLCSKYLFDVVHFYTQYRVKLSVFACTVETQPRMGKDRVWASSMDFSKYPLPSGTKKIIDKLKL